MKKLDSVIRKLEKGAFGNMGYSGGAKLHIP